MKTKTKIFIFSILILIFTAYTMFLLSQTDVKEMPSENEDCMMCHSDNELEGEKNGKTVSMFVDTKKYLASVHFDKLCVDCHIDLKDSEIPHDDELEPASCNKCHKEADNDYKMSLHGRAKKKGDPLAPDCNFCHGKHDIVFTDSDKSKLSPLKIPYLCGTCHKEGSKVQLSRNIHQTHIIENYSQSIHGEGLFKKGLTVTATCISCHTSHKILPHDDKNSSISRNNIAKTCSNCHTKIEEVHKKIVNGELWEKEPHKLPACVDCHQPHKIRKEKYSLGLSNNECLNCHTDANKFNSEVKDKMFFNTSEFGISVHKNLQCVECHVQATPVKIGRACATINNDVNCGSCHENVSIDYLKSTHGKLHSNNDIDAPTCKTCHGNHLILSKSHPESKIFPLSVPDLCSKCHESNAVAAKRLKNVSGNFVDHYSSSIHGKKLADQGMTVTATCSDCHEAHFIVGKNNPTSSIHKNNVTSTCGKCHWGIKESFDQSIHSKKVSNSDKDLPTCEDCHKSHELTDPNTDEFRHSILSTCGNCHQELSESYFDTYHGKASALGSSKSAKCHDCHTAHMILPASFTKSSLNTQNIVNTCQTCHANANIGLTKYLAHATHHDPDKYPLLFITFWGMTILLLGTFIISWVHTLLWLPKSLKMRKYLKSIESKNNDHVRIRRFTPTQRMQHVVMVLSFLILALTGMVLKFSNSTWASYAVNMFGSIETAGYFHRFAATLLFLVFISHVISLIKLKREEYNSWKELLFDEDSMLPNRKDWEDLKGTMKWFLGKGERPQYGRWTYWEKFDYFAVFWGIFVIGSTGLTLWFPSLFTAIFPGDLINVATIIHSDEALLAAGFIFTIHFFNTHFRPEKFPMDTVVFTGSYGLEEFKFDRPNEYNKLLSQGELEKYIVNEPPLSVLKASKIFGWVALSIGIVIIIMIVISIITSW